MEYKVKGRELHVGEYVWLTVKGNLSSYYKKPVAAIISKLGTKYYYVTRVGGCEEWKFPMGNDKSYMDYGVEWSLFFSEEEIAEVQESEKLYREVKKVLEDFPPIKLSLDQLKRIKKILEESL